MKKYYQTKNGFIVDEANQEIPMQTDNVLYFTYLAFLKQGGAVEPTNFEIEVVEPKTLIELIRERYSIDDEFAILRQKDSKPNEFNEYFHYVENCKINKHKL